MIERNFNPMSDGAFEMKVAGSQEAIEKFLELLEGQPRRAGGEDGPADAAGAAPVVLKGAHSFRLLGGARSEGAAGEAAMTIAGSLGSAGSLCEGGVHAVSGNGRLNLLEAARDLNLRIECYTELPEYDLSEHAVVNGGELVVYETRTWAPLSRAQPDFADYSQKYDALAAMYDMPAGKLSKDAFDELADKPIEVGGYERIYEGRAQDAPGSEPRLPLMTGGAGAVDIPVDELLQIAQGYAERMPDDGRFKRAIRSLEMAAKREQRRKQMMEQAAQMREGGPSSARPRLAGADAVARPRADATARQPQQPSRARQPQQPIQPSRARQPQQPSQPAAASAESARRDAKDVAAELVGALLERFGDAATLLPACFPIWARLRIGNFHTAEIAFALRSPVLLRVTMREAGVIRDFPYEEGFERRIADFMEETARTFRYHIYPAGPNRFAFDPVEPLGCFADWREGLDRHFPGIRPEAVHVTRSDARELSFGDPGNQASPIRFNEKVAGRLAKCDFIDDEAHAECIACHFPGVEVADARSMRIREDDRFALVVEDAFCAEPQDDPAKPVESEPTALAPQKAMGALLSSWAELAPGWRVNGVESGRPLEYVLDVAYAGDEYGKSLEGALGLVFGEGRSGAGRETLEGGAPVCFRTARLHGRIGGLVANDAGVGGGDLPVVDLPVMSGPFEGELVPLDQWAASFSEGLARIAGLVGERWDAFVAAATEKAPCKPAASDGGGALSPSAFACALGEAVVLDPRLELDSMTVKDGAVVDAAEEFGAANISGPDGEPVGALRAMVEAHVSGACTGFGPIPLIMHVCEGAESGVLVARFEYLPNERPWSDSSSTQTRPYPAPCESLPPYGVFPSTRALLDFAADITRPRSQMLAVYRHRADDGSIDFGKVDFIGCDDWRQAADEFCDGCEPLGYRQCDRIHEFKRPGLVEQARAIASSESVKYLAVTPVRWLPFTNGPLTGENRGERRMMAFALQRLATEPCGYRLIRTGSGEHGLSCEIAHPSRSHTVTLEIGRGEPDARAERPTCEASSGFSWPPETRGKVSVTLDLLSDMSDGELDRFDIKLARFLGAFAALAGEE